MHKKAVEQEYDPKPVWPECRNCKFFTFEKSQSYYSLADKNLRCSLGNFAVKKLGTCRKHEFKEIKDVK